MNKLIGIRNRDKYYCSVRQSATNTNGKRGGYYLFYPNTVYPFKYYEMDMFVSKTIAFNGSEMAYRYKNTYRVTEVKTGSLMGLEWETPEKAKVEATKKLRTNDLYRKCLDLIPNFDWSK